MACVHLAIYLLLRALKPRCHCALDSLTARANRLNELLGLPGIGLILEAVLRPSDRPVENSPFFVVIFPWDDPSTFPELAVEIGLGSCGREVVTVHTGHK